MSDLTEFEQSQLDETGHKRVQNLQAMVNEAYEANDIAALYSIACRLANQLAVHETYTRKGVPSGHKG